MSTNTTDHRPTASFYEEVGGHDAVAAAVSLFYRRVLDDPQLKHYFVDADLARLESHQVALMSQVLGGPSSYSGRSLAAAHRGLGISQSDFQAVGQHLLAVLAELRVRDEIQRHVRETLETLAPDIVEREG